jgi:hypothetical protein
MVIQDYVGNHFGDEMRGAFEDQGRLFSYISPEGRVPKNHPLRQVRALVREVLGELNRSLGRLYSSEGRPSIPPEQLLSALLLQVFYGIRSERQLMEQLDYNLLYRWFFRPKDGSGDEDGGANFHGQKRKNDTHASVVRSCAATAWHFRECRRSSSQAVVTPSRGAPC